MPLLELHFILMPYLCGYSIIHIWMWTGESSQNGEESLDFVLWGMIERCRMFSLRKKRFCMASWLHEGLSFQRGVGTIPCSPSKWSRGRCKGDAEQEGSERSGASEHRAGASGGQSPEQPKCFCLFSFGKHPSIRWVNEQGDPFQLRVCEMEGGAGQKGSRDEHIPGVYYCFKWREEQEIIHFHRGVFLVSFANIHGRHFYSITIIKALLMSLIQQGYHLLVSFIFH